MGASAKELLYLLLWAADRLLWPTAGKCFESFESWAYRNGYLRELQRLEKEGLLRKPDLRARASRLPQAWLTAEGVRRVLGGRDPEAEWARPWDGRWRLVVFDLPQSRDSERKRLRRFLREQRFGCFQKSVWTSPDPIGPVLEALRRHESDVCRLTMLEATALGETPASAIVASSWDFVRINTRYRGLLDLLAQAPIQSASATRTNAIRAWLQSEQAAWVDAVGPDPLLPEALLPPGYLGREAWARRQEVLRALAPRLLD